ncbi:MAG: adenylyl-sulfate kinase [Spirochaetaceae bacterium]|nr:adenylyl-sulfate kinase [Spirochaetaceae bacterium]
MLFHQNVKSGLNSDIGDQFLSRDEHIRRLGELSRIMTDAGLIFISTLDDADEYDLESIRQLNSPNELIVVNVGKNNLDENSVSLNLNENPDMNEAVKNILNLLSVYQVIPDYCI